MSERGRSTAATIGIAVGMVLVVLTVLIVLLGVAGLFFARSSTDRAVQDFEVVNGIADGPWVTEFETVQSGDGDTTARFTGMIGNDGSEEFSVISISSPMCEVIALDEFMTPLLPLAERPLDLTCEGLSGPLLAGEPVPLLFEFEPFGELETGVLVDK